MFIRPFTPINSDVLRHSYVYVLILGLQCRPCYVISHAVFVKGNYESVSVIPHSLLPPL